MSVLNSVFRALSGGTAAQPVRVSPPVGQPAGQSARPQARYLRDTPGGALASRRVGTTEHQDDVRRSWSRCAALAMDLIQNSGQLKGACDQVIADTVGVGLTLTPQPNLKSLGWTEEAERDWVSLVRRRWALWQKTPTECDLRGKISLPQMVDIGLRWYIAYGEVTGVFDYFGSNLRGRYGIHSGTKLCLVPPTRLVQTTNMFDRMVQGIRHDENGRPVSYRFSQKVNGIKTTRDHGAFDGDGRPQVLHVFDPMDATDVRGVSLLASAFRKYIQAETLDETTLQTAILQTIFSIVLTSETPSAEAFEALQSLNDTSGYAEEFMGFMASKLDSASDSRISVGAEPQVSHLGPGEELELKTAGTPGQNFMPYRAALNREMARAIGISYGGLTMDHTNATYSSVRMETASIWGVVMRRRERIAAPICQMAYQSWLDEEIGEGRIPFRGGYEAFRANREQVCSASWQGPARPTADDFKSARASTARLENGTSSIEIETGELGIDAEELFQQRKREHDMYVEAGMASPYAPKPETSGVVVDPDAPEDGAQSGNSPA